MFRHFLPGVAWALFILLICGMPGKDIPHISFLEMLSFDKFVHAAIFCILQVLFMHGYHRSGKLLDLKVTLLILSLCIVYGGLLELAQQAFFEDRSADLYDFIANSIGAYLGSVIYGKILKKRIAKDQ
jgi:VanZ family protein